MTSADTTPGVRHVGWQRLETVIADKYHLEGEVGRGSFAIVYKAHHAGLSTLCYAIKVLRCTVSDDPSIVARFKREARVLASLRSPYVVPVIDFGETQAGLPYLVMPLLHGQSVDALLERDGRLRSSDVARFCLDVLSGLEEAHAGGMIHRDLKPANIFITAASGKVHPKATVLDFGIVKVIDDSCSVVETADHLFLGTPAYAAPELLRGSPDPRCDLYALGHSMIAMLEGSPPYGREPTHALAISRHLSDGPVPLEDSTRHCGLADVIQRACSKSAISRFQTATEMREAILATGLHRTRDKPLQVGPTKLLDRQLSGTASHHRVDQLPTDEYNPPDDSTLDGAPTQPALRRPTDSTVDLHPATLRATGEGARRRTPEDEPGDE